MTKKAGVPVAPSELASAMSASIAGLACAAVSACSKRFTSSPTSFAYCSSWSLWNFAWFANSTSWYSQNFPCSYAAIDASAAGMANGCMPSGLFFQTMRTLSP